jgi:hypothetical protein
MSDALGVVRKALRHEQGESPDALGSKRRAGVEYRKQSHGNTLFLHAYGAGFTVLGQIRSLGLCRVTYEFIDFGEDHPGEVRVDIFSSDEGLYLSSLSCVLIEEHLSEPGNPLTTLMLKRCELEFRHLTPDQEKKLREFLRHDCLRRVQDMTATRRSKPKQLELEETMHIKPRSLFSPARPDERAVYCSMAESMG